MLVFIVPVKSKQLSRISWEHSSKILERSLRSLCSQTSPDFQVIVVHHETPEIEFKHPSVKYIEVDFPIPTWAEPSTPYRDKGRKIWTALQTIIGTNQSHIMCVDSDDCVSRRLADFVNRNNSCNGWFFNKGYEYKDGGKRVYRRKTKFHLKCGTSHIIRHDLLLPFSRLTFEEVDDQFLWHQELVKNMAAKGTPLEPLPFEGATYISDTGENHVNLTDLFIKRFQSNPIDLLLFWARRAYKAINCQRLSDEICNEFGIYKI
jgi:glycosyltransferase involved in cell wall biosynthesis